MSERNPSTRESETETKTEPDESEPEGGGPSAGAATPVVRADSVRRRFGDLTVLSDVSFEAAPGTVNCVVGPNGSGKTTLLRIVAGLLAPTAGSVTLDVDGDAGEGGEGGGERDTGRTVGYLPQTPSFRPGFTLTETLELYVTLAGAAADPEAVLERVGLDRVADRRVEALSGGMTRLFGIAQATIGDPPVLVLDEPSSGLDPRMTEHVGTVIEDLAAGGRTVLLATHELGTVDRVGDAVLVLDDGVVRTAASPAELRRETGAGTLTGAVNEFITGDADGVTVRTGHGDDGPVTEGATDE